ncbi:unnamed protein product [Merluccius merluccius]
MHLPAISEGGSGLFLCLFEYTIQKDPELARILSTIPRNATYTNHNIKNQITELMSNNIVTEEKISIIVRFVHLHQANATGLGGC